MDNNKLIELFEYALESENSETVDEAVNESLSIDNPEDVTPYLVQLLESPWHFGHEDITLVLQRIGDPRATEVLLKTATRKFEYLEYDDSKSLSRKCTWALADIGTKESKEALKVLAKKQDNEIAEFAQKRLDNWEHELARKKHCC